MTSHSASAIHPAACISTDGPHIHACAHISIINRKIVTFTMHKAVYVMVITVCRPNECLIANAVRVFLPRIPCLSEHYSNEYTNSDAAHLDMPYRYPISV